MNWIKSVHSLMGKALCEHRYLQYLTINTDSWYEQGTVETWEEIPTCVKSGEAFRTRWHSPKGRGRVSMQRGQQDVVGRSRNRKHRVEQAGGQGAHVEAAGERTQEGFSEPVDVVLKVPGHLWKAKPIGGPARVAFWKDLPRSAERKVGWRPRRNRLLWGRGRRAPLRRNHAGAAAARPFLPPRCLRANESGPKVGKKKVGRKKVGKKKVGLRTMTETPQLVRKRGRGSGERGKESLWKGNVSSKHPKGSSLVTLCETRPVSGCTRSSRS